MPTALSVLQADLALRLADSSNRAWSAAELATYLNEGTRTVARRTESIMSYRTSIAAVAGTAKYALATDVIRVHRFEFVPTGSTQTYPMTIKTYDEMDQIWGINQLIQSSYPSYAVLWGMPGTVVTNSQLNVQVYPVPAQAGTINVYYYRTPLTMAAAGDLCEVPEGWQDLVVKYAEAIARRKYHDASWAEDMQMFEQDITYLIDVSRNLTDTQQEFITATGSASPQWLYEFWDG